MLGWDEVSISVGLIYACELWCAAQDFREYHQIIFLLSQALSYPFKINGMTFSKFNCGDSIIKVIFIQSHVTDI